MNWRDLAWMPDLYMQFFVPPYISNKSLLFVCLFVWYAIYLFLVTGSLNCGSSAYKSKATFTTVWFWIGDQDHNCLCLFKKTCVVVSFLGYSKCFGTCWYISNHYWTLLRFLVAEQTNARATLDKQSCVITSMLFEMNSTCMRLCDLNIICVSTSMTSPEVSSCQNKQCIQIQYGRPCLHFVSSNFNFVNLL